MEPEPRSLRGGVKSETTAVSHRPSLSVGKAKWAEVISVSCRMKQEHKQELWFPKCNVCRLVPSSCRPYSDEGEESAGSPHFHAVTDVGSARNKTCVPPS